MRQDTLKLQAARLADELRNEQEIAQAYEKDRKLFECQIKNCFDTSSIGTSLQDFMLAVIATLKRL